MNKHISRSISPFAQQFPVTRCAALLAAALILAGLLNAQAIVKTWDGGAAPDGNWSNGLNWTDDLAPAASDSLVFTGSTQTDATNTVTSGRQYNGITFDSGATAFTLWNSVGNTTGELTLSGSGITNNSTALQTVNCPLRANSVLTLNASAGPLLIGGNTRRTSGTGSLVILGAQNVTISGVIDSSVTGGITNLGPGTLTLSGANSYAGNTTIIGGALNLGASGVIPDGVGKGSVLMNPAAGTATLDIAGQSESINGLTNSGAGSSVVDNTAGTGVLTIGTADTASIFGGVFQNSGGTLTVTKTGTNILTLNGASTHSGATTISAGTLKLGASGSLGANSTVVIAAGGTFDVSAQTTYTLGANASLNASGTGVGVGTTAAYINGGGTVDLGSRPVALTITPTAFLGDSAHPALYVSSGLTLSGAITVTNNGASPLGVGSYKLIAQVGGSIGGTPILAGVFGQGLAASTAASVTNIGSDTWLVVASTGSTPTVATLTRHAGTGSATTYGDAVEFDVSLSPSAATGMVTLLDDDATVLGTGTLVGGSCTITPALNALKAGTHTNIVAVYGGGGGYLPTNSAALSTQTVAQKTLSVTGAAALSRYYNGTTAAALTGTLVGVVSGDTLSYGTGTFANPGPGTGIAVTSSSSPDGPAAANYTISPLPAGLTADIYAAGVWGGAVDNLWNSAGNWTNNLVPSGANIAADFTALDLISDTTVNLDSPQTIGSLIFGDTDTNSPAGWILANNGVLTNTLTLAGALPTVTVNGLGDTKHATITAALAGSAGLTKTGNGELNLAATNIYSGPTTISAGVLSFSGAGQLGGGDYAGRITNNATLQFGGTAAQKLSGVVSGTGTLVQTGSGALTLTAPNTFSGGTLFSGSGVITVVTNGSLGVGPVTMNTGASRLSLSDGVVINNPVTINAATPGTGNAALNGNGSGTATINGPISINGGTAHIGNNVGGTVVVNGAITATVPVHIRRSTVVVVGGGSYTSLLLNQDTLRLGTNNGISTQAVLFVTSISSRNGIFDLNGFNQELAGLQGPGSNSTATTTNGTATPVTLTLNTTADSTYGGTIVGNVTVVKTGAAIQTLGNTNSYSGITTIGEGTLALGATGLILGSPTISVASNATFDVTAVSGGYILEAGQTLKGHGTVNGSVIANGTVAPGASIGTLTFSSDLTLAGTNIMEVTKDGGLTNDVIAIAGTPTFGGTLRVVLVGSTALAVNDTFKLFQFSIAPGANFPAFDLPGGGYTWDTSQLTVDGTIKVTGIPSPSSPPPPATLTGVSRSGSNMTMIWSGGTNQSVVLLSATNVTQPRATWTPVQTNAVLSDGLSTNVVPINASERSRFYQLSIPYP